MELTTKFSVVRSGGRLLALTLALALILGSVASPAAAAEPEWELRWRDPDPPYAEMGFPRKVVSNLRVGVVDLFDSVGQGVMGLFYIAIITSVIAYGLWTWALKSMSATRVAVFTNLQPVFTALLSWSLLGEDITTPTILGGLLVIAGITALQRGGRRAESRMAEGVG